MTDPRLAPLAAALIEIDPDLDYEDFAAAILAALPPDWCGHGAYESEMERLWSLDRADLARLRKIEGVATEADAVAAERARITRELKAVACQCLDHAECAGCHEDGESLDDLSFAAVLAIVKPEADHA